MKSGSGACSHWFDHAIVVALLLLPGNWFANGDQIKTSLLVVLLIFYLKQIIEIPWDHLYQNPALAHAFCTPKLPPFLNDTPEERSNSQPPESRNSRYPSSSSPSPSLSTCPLLRFAAAALGLRLVSWFSTGPFIPVTGIRPWSQVVSCTLPCPSSTPMRTTSWKGAQRT